MRLPRPRTPRQTSWIAVAVLSVSLLILLQGCRDAAAPNDDTRESIPARPRTTATAPPGVKDDTSPDTSSTPAPTPATDARPDDAGPDPSPMDTRAAPPSPPPGQPTADELELPSGFTAYRWASNYFQPTAIEFSPDGRLFIAQRFGSVWTAADLDADGVAEDRVLFADDFAEPLTGLLVVDDRTVYVSDESHLYRLHDRDADGIADAREVVLGELPFGLHHSNGLTLGPEGRLYLTIGSSCNECVEPDPRSATIQALDLDDGTLETIATGLRNPYDLAFTPDGELWATDNGSDPPCPTPDELNRIVAGADYGWPYCAAAAPQRPSEEPAITLGLHSSANGLVWLDDHRWPDDWRGGFYVALFGSFSPDARDVGRRVQFVRLQEDSALALHDFALGLLRPLDLTLGADGALYVADFTAGVIYRILPPPGD